MFPPIRNSQRICIKAPVALLRFLLLRVTPSLQAQNFTSILLLWSYSFSRDVAVCSDVMCPSTQQGLLEGPLRRPSVRSKTKNVYLQNLLWHILFYFFTSTKIVIPTMYPSQLLYSSTISLTDFYCRLVYV